MLAAPVPRLGSTFQPDLWTTKELKRYTPVSPTPWPYLSAARSVTRGFPARVDLQRCPAAAESRRRSLPGYTLLDAQGVREALAASAEPRGFRSRDARGTEDPSFLSSHRGQECLPGSLQLPAGLPRKRSWDLGAFRLKTHVSIQHSGGTRVLACPGLQR